MKLIPVASPCIEEEEAKAVYDVIKSGWITMGEKVREFESAVADYTGAKYAVAMNNGTSTLHSILMALEVGPGDEVIIPSLTYISAANVVLYQGAKLVLCDSDPSTFNVTPDQIKEKITSKTKAFITVDLKGLPVDFDEFKLLAEEHKISFISDSAESFGAIYKGTPVGKQAYAHSFSFFANKNITTGEGGMITTDDHGLYKKLIIIRNQGQEGRYNHTMLGNNFRMTDIQAALGIEQIKKIDQMLAEKLSLAKNYNKNFSEIKEVSIPKIPEYVTRHSWYLYSLKVSPNLRNALVRHLNISNIETRISFPPVHIQPYFKKRFGFKINDCPLAIQAYESFIDIPIWVGMGNKAQKYIVGKITSFILERPK